MNIFHYAGHIGYLLTTMSFMVRDMMYLRLLAICASLFSISYNYYARPVPQWIDIGWDGFFILVNAVQILVLMYERRQIDLTGKERELYETVFKHLTPVEYKKILNMASWRRIGPRAVMVGQGQVMESIMLIYHGRTSVQIDGQMVAELSDGHFIGEMSFMTQRAASATVETLVDTEYLIWEQKALKGLITRNPHLFYSLQSAMGGQVIEKLIQQSLQKIPDATGT